MEEDMKFKRMIISVLVILLVCNFSAFSSGQDETSEVEKEEVTIMLHPVLYSATGGEGGLISRFSEETGIDVEVLTGPLDQILEKTLLDFVSNTSSIDVFVYTDTAMHSGLTEFLLPLDDYIANAGADYKFNDILNSAVQLNTLNGKVYGIPFRYGVYMLYYRQDLFDKYNVSVPETWEEFNAAAKQITEGLRADGINDIYGLVYPAQTGHYIFEVYKTWLAGHGGVIADENGEVKLNSPEAIKALDSLIEPYIKGWVSPEVPTMATDQSIAAFQNGKAAMALCYSPYWGLFTDPEKSSVSDTVNWALTPHSPGVEYGRSSVSGWQMLINKNAKYTDAAWKLVQYLTEADSALEMAMNYSNGPIRDSVLTSDEYLNKFPVAKGWAKSFAASDSLLPGGHEKISEIMDIIGREVSSAFLGEKTSEEAMDDAQKAVESIF
jgi:multiple sugar transport system substrate-binding protein